MEKRAMQVGERPEDYRIVPSLMSFRLLRPRSCPPQTGGEHMYAPMWIYKHHVLHKVYTTIFYPKRLLWSPDLKIGCELRRTRQQPISATMDTPLWAHSRHAAFAAQRQGQPPGVWRHHRHHPHHMPGARAHRSPMSHPHASTTWLPAMLLWPEQCCIN